MTLLKVLPFIVLAISMFIFPQEVVASASTGLSLWANYILPALFPFFILADLLMKQGLVDFLGALMEPLMRPIFRLPGKAAFIIAMIHTSGIPIGAILTSKLRKSGEISRLEGERLLAFTSNPSPGFMLGAVASGMLGNAAVGIVIAASVYLANLGVGLIFRFYGTDSEPAPSGAKYTWRHSYQKLKKYQYNKKPFGELLADAVRESTATILLVGGYIIFFSVITHLLVVLGISSRLANLIHMVSAGQISLLGGDAIIQGFMETTLGCKAAVLGFQSMSTQVGVICFMLGWGGLSVFAQVLSFTTSTDLRFRPFIIGRIIHAVFALFLSQVFLKFMPIQTANLSGFLSVKTPWLFSLKWCCILLLCFVLVFVILRFLSELYLRRYQ
ncbi:sporulation integral membrane protein YlbJ [Dehalobacter sp. DCM]|uniref:nucleoside recognition domain-containing protein n=1 Tax=Dehalobacter sp. DCM TaxID=2907827 RepID=UPI00308200F9|nr:sporulation integral membrane protein YlbJ [Dehalobacter sp. DCM]